jgi:hypothetical protein
VVNVVLEAFVVKQEVLDKDDTLVSYLHFPSSTYIDLRDSFDEDVSLLVNFWFIFALGFKCVHCGGRGFKSKLGLG